MIDRNRQLIPGKSFTTKTHQEGVTNDPTWVPGSRRNVTPEAEIKDTPEAELAGSIDSTKVHIISADGPCFAAECHCNLDVCVTGYPLHE